MDGAQIKVGAGKRDCGARNFGFAIDNSCRGEACVPDCVVAANRELCGIAQYGPSAVDYCDLYAVQRREVDRRHGWLIGAAEELKLGTGAKRGREGLKVIGNGSERAGLPRVQQFFAVLDVADCRLPAFPDRCVLFRGGLSS